MDKYKAVWVSHSSISDFLKCQRAYYLKNIYKDPRTGRKVSIVTPPLALGLSVHSVLENLSNLPVEERFKENLTSKFEEAWKKVSGKMGGFKTKEQEEEFKARGLAMIKRVEENPGPLLNKAIKIKSEMGLPNYPLSEEDGIILCGKIDWLEYLEDTDSVNIIDFKTGKNEESDDSLQLPIYLLLVKNTQKRNVEKASYWYIDKSSDLIEKKLPNEKEAFDKVYEVAKRIKLARQLEHFVCQKNGCMHCVPFERILRGEGERVGLSDTKQDIYVLD